MQAPWYSRNREEEKHAKKKKTGKWDYLCMPATYHLTVADVMPLISSLWDAQSAFISLVCHSIQSLMCLDLRTCTPRAPSTLPTIEMASAVLTPVGMSKRNKACCLGWKAEALTPNSAAVPSSAAAVSVKTEAATTAVVAAVAAFSSNSNNSTNAGGSSNKSSSSSVTDAHCN